MPLTIEPLSPDLTFGAQVRGLCADDLLDPANRAALKQAFIQHGLIVFRAVSVTNALHGSLSEVFGETALHPLRHTMAVEDHPELIRLRYEAASETLFDVDGELLGGYIPWHFDAVFMPKINRGGVLRMETPPAQGGATGFIDRIDVYATLPERLRQRIEGREVAYAIAYDYAYFPRSTIRIVKEGEIYRKARLERAAGKLPLVAHRLSYRQAETGRMVLNFSPWPAQYVLGMEPEESRDLLLELALYATDETRAFFHEWSGLDEMVAWDNWRMLHKACGVPPDDERAVIRTTIAGDYGLGRLIPEEELRPDMAPIPA